jgi:uncharacterized membrane protein
MISQMTGAGSAPAWLFALLAFAASLTPSLVPRDFMIQGALSGASAAIGYGFGLLLVQAWKFLELPVPKRRLAAAAGVLAALAGAAFALAALVKVVEWQNSIRSLMSMEPLDAGYRLEIVLIALAVFVFLYLLARLFAASFRLFARWMSRIAPPRVAAMLGGLLAVLLFWSVAQGVIFKTALGALDSSFRELDALVEDGTSAPADPMKTGSAASLLPWDGLGRQGHRFLANGPSRDDIAVLTGGQAKQPVRVYAGLNSAGTVEERARLALEELKRTGGFDRSVLVVIVPTGTGWVDPSAIDPLEYVHRGDVASVAVQYSYLASWLSLLVQPEYGAETGRALFRAVYNHWTLLPRDRRPKLYLHGLSLGAMGSESSTDFIDVLADPFQGAVWSGPPFPSRGWRAATAARDAGSPQWLPRFRDGSAIRFTNQDSAGVAGGAWGPLRIVYLQYASDPITFFEESTFYSKPEWMATPRGPDVSPRLSWYPAITFLQLVVDMAIGTTTPMGYGHVYAPENYLDAWVAVTAPPDASPEFVRKIREHLRARRN